MLKELLLLLMEGLLRKLIIIFIYGISYSEMEIFLLEIKRRIILGWVIFGKFEDILKSRKVLNE